MMKLKVLDSGSKRNGYILETEKEILIIEAGVPYKQLLQAIDFQYQKIVGCIVSHCHIDHSYYLKEYKKNGINAEWWFKHGLRMVFGGFMIKPFELHHDEKCFGFYITHKQMGNLVFITDTAYVDYRFPNVHHFMVECNYSKEILDQRVQEGFNPVLADRIIGTHFGLDNVKEFFRANDLTATRNVVLLHLSDRNSNEKQFEHEIAALTNKNTYIASKGLEVDLSLVPF